MKYTTFKISPVKYIKDPDDLISEADCPDENTANLIADVLFKQIKE